jgi:DNA-binding transcriptional ArsR family regulator
MSFGDETDQKIISILKYGKRQQVEISELIDRNKSTVRRHLDYLEDNYEVSSEKKNNKKYYYLDDEGETIVPPKPNADAEEVNKILFNIYKNIGLSNSNNNPSPDDLLENIIEFEIIAGEKYYVVDVEENINRFLDIFDYIVDTLTRKKENNILVTEDLIYMYFNIANRLYSNWEKGKENRDYHEHLTNRIDDIHSIIGSSPKKIEREAQALLFKISNSEGQKAFISMVKSEKYESDELLSGPIYAYNQKNDLDKLLKDLDDIEDATSNKKYITEVTEEIRNRFIQSFDSM